MKRPGVWEGVHIGWGRLLTPSRPPRGRQESHVIGSQSTCPPVLLAPSVYCVSVRVRTDRQHSTADVTKASPCAGDRFRGPPVYTFHAGLETATLTCTELAARLYLISVPHPEWPRSSHIAHHTLPPD